MSPVLLVGCGAAKAPSARPAAELYIGSLTRAAIRHAQASGNTWYIISALHGLVEPDRMLEPYNVRVTDMGRAERREWAARAASDLGRRHPGADVEFHAGGDYVRELGPELEAGHRVTAPLSGLVLGLRLAWYSRRSPTAPINGANGANTSNGAHQRRLAVGQRRSNGAPTADAVLQRHQRHFDGAVGAAVGALSTPPLVPLAVPVEDGAGAVYGGS